MNLVAPTRSRKKGGNTAPGRNPHDSIPIGAKNDYVIPAPGATENRDGGIADHLRRATGNVDSFQLASRLKCNEPAIRGPKSVRPIDIFCAR